MTPELRSGGDEVTSFILIHSPLVGPLTWSLVADELQRRGYEVMVPILRADESSTEPHWKQYADSVAQALASVPVERELALVAHSGAGVLLPAIREAIGRPVAAYIFVDAGIPEDGKSHLDLWGSRERAQEFREFLAAGGRFPTWTEEDLREDLPDASQRLNMVAELHPQPLAYWEEPVPVFDGWPDAPCAYLLFTPRYASLAAYAQEKGWAVRRMDDGHFYMLVDPEGVTNTILDLVNEALR